MASHEDARDPAHGAAGLWWALGQMTRQPPPASLAAPYRDAIAEVAAALPPSRQARASLLARWLADIAAPPIARYLAQLDPSWSAHLEEILDGRVLTLAIARCDGQATAAGHAAPEPLRAWAVRVAAAHLAPRPVIDAPADAWALGHHAVSPWHQLQAEFTRSAARQLAQAAATQPGLLSVMAAALKEPSEQRALHEAAHELATGPGKDATLWPGSGRAALRAWQASASSNRLLEVAVRLLAPLPMAPELRARLAHRLPRSMLPLLA